MKSLDRIPLLANVLIVACSRPNAEVGKLVKSVVTYATDGTRTSLDDLRLEAYFDLIAQDLDTLRTAADAKSRKCSESAKCRTARSNSPLHNPAKKANAATARQRAISEDAKDSPTADISNNVDISEESDDSRRRIDSEEPVVPGNFNSSDATSSFERIKDAYGKTGVNESQALGVWQQLSEDERMAAFAHAQRLQSDLSSRSYLYVYLRDKEWTKEVSPDKP